MHMTLGPTATLSRKPDPGHLTTIQVTKVINFLHLAVDLDLALLFSDCSSFKLAVGSSVPCP